MTNQHPSNMEIARLIDDKVTPDEREKILNHIDECDECFEVYGEILRFNEIETARKRKVWIPAAAAVLLCAILFPFLWQKFRQTAFEPIWTNVPGTVAVHHIEENISQIQNRSTYGFSPGSTFSLVRLGFYVEDLKRLANSPERQLKGKVLQLLDKEWGKVFEEELKLEELDRDNIDDRSIEKIEREIKAHLNRDPLEDLYSLGKYIERSIFLCIDGRHPNMKLIDKFSRISQENKLPRKIPGLFAKTINEKKLDNILKNLKAIQEIFL